MTEVVIRACVQTQDIDPVAEQAWLRAQGQQIGAILEFTGYVRPDAEAGEGVQALYLEHYAGMTEKTMQEIASEACSRWPLQAISMVHRVGQLQLGERIIYLGVASAHRKAGLAAVDFMMDFLKQDVPIWKKELRRESSAWVEPKGADIAAKKAWD